MLISYQKGIGWPNLGLSEPSLQAFKWKCLVLNEFKSLVEKWMVAKKVVSRQQLQDDLCICIWISVMIIHPDTRETGYSNVLLRKLSLKVPHDVFADLKSWLMFDNWMRGLCQKLMIDWSGARGGLKRLKRFSAIWIIKTPSFSISPPLNN